MIDNRLADQLFIVGSKCDSIYFRAQGGHLLAQNRREAIFDQTMKNFVTGDHQSDRCLAKGFNRQHRAVLPYFACPHISGEGMILGGIVDVTPELLQIILRQGRGVDLKQSVGGSQQVDLALMGVILPGNAFACQGIGQNSGGLVFVDFVLLQIDDVEIIFSKFLEVAQIFVADRMTFTKGGTLKIAGSNLGYVVGQLGADGINIEILSGLEKTDKIKVWDKPIEK